VTATIVTQAAVMPKLGTADACSLLDLCCSASQVAASIAFSNIARGRTTSLEQPILGDQRWPQRSRVDSGPGPLGTSNADSIWFAGSDIV